MRTSINLFTGVSILFGKDVNNFVKAVRLIRSIAGIQLDDGEEKNLIDSENFDTFKTSKSWEPFLRRAERQARLLVITSVSDLVTHLVFFCSH